MRILYCTVDRSFGSADKVFLAEEVDNGNFTRKSPPQVTKNSLQK